MVIEIIFSKMLNCVRTFAAKDSLYFISEKGTFYAVCAFQSRFPVTFTSVLSSLKQTRLQAVWIKLTLSLSYRFSVCKDIEATNRFSVYKDKETTNHLKHLLLDRSVYICADKRLLIGQEWEVFAGMYTRGISHHEHLYQPRKHRDTKKGPWRGSFKWSWKSVTTVKNSN